MGETAESAASPDPGTSPDPAASPDPQALAANLVRMDDLTRRLVAALAQRPAPASPEDAARSMAREAPGPDLYGQAASAWMQGWASHPQRMIEAQIHLWRDTLVNAVEAQTLAMRQMTGAVAGDADSEPPAKPPARPRDKRFANPLWETNPWFRFARDQYLAQTRAVEDMLGALEGLTPREEARVGFFARQMVDLMSPANFLATNPDALEKAVATQGRSLVDGLENLVRDLERGGGELAVTLADPDAFRVGENIATAPGRVVHRCSS